MVWPAEKEVRRLRLAEHLEKQGERRAETDKGDADMFYDEPEDTDPAAGAGSVRAGSVRAGSVRPGSTRAGGGEDAAGQDVEGMGPFEQVFDHAKCSRGTRAVGTIEKLHNAREAVEILERL